MALTTKRKFREELHKGTFDFPTLVSATDFYVLVVDNTHTPADLDEFVSDISGEEVSNTGYARHVLANPTWAWDAGQSAWKLDADDHTWSSVAATGNPWSMVYLAIDIGADTADRLVGYDDFANITPNGGNIDYQLNTNGIYVAK